MQQLPASLTAALKTLSQREGVTLYMTLLAAFQTLLARYTGHDDIVLGSFIANRTKAETEALIGFFVNTLALRTDLSGNPSFRELLRRVREVTLGAYAHQDLPFEQLVRTLQAEHDPSRHPLFQVTFLLQNAPLPPLEVPALRLNVMDIDRGVAQYDLALSLTDADDGLKGKWMYTTDLFDDATIQRMASHFQVLLEGIVADPAQHIADPRLSRDAESHQSV